MSELPKRLQTLTASLDELGVDAMLIGDETNVSYLSGFGGDSSFLLVQPQGTTILSDGRYELQIASECGGLSAVIRPPEQLLPDLIRSILSDLGSARVGIEADHFALSSFRYFSQHCPRIEFVETSGVVERQRMIKDRDEIETTRRSVRIAERAYQAVIPMLSGDSSERSIAHELEAKMRLLGADRCSFEPIVAVGPSGALPHYRPGAATIGDAATLLIDWGAFFEGYASDLTRTLHSDHASEAFRRAYQAVLEAQLAAIDAIRPGIEAKQVDAAARNVLAQAGLGEAFKHGLGHGTGLQIHEMPRMSASSEETLASGMIVTVEPGVYFDGDFGIRIEDDVLVTETGREILSHLPKGLDDCRFLL